MGLSKKLLKNTTKNVMDKEKIEARTPPTWQSMKYLALTYCLEGCEVFNILDDETKDREWNGIGPDRMPKIVRELLDKIFEDALPAACIHDFRFVIGGTKAQFYTSNAELKRNLFKCLRANKPKYSWFRYWLTKLKILIAVALCDKYGYKGWHKHD